MIEIPTSTFLDKFRKTNGAFSVAEGIALYNICLEAQQGDWMELGTHKGKSSMAIALAIPEKASALYLVEPEFKDTTWRNEVCARIFSINEVIKLSMYADYSLNVIEKHTADLAFVFVDSGVHDDMVMEEVKLLEDKMILQGIIAFHDYKNQFTAVERAYEYLLSTGKYEKVEIDWPAILKYVTENNLEEGNQSWHIYDDLGHPPNFVGAVRRK
jgi:predicted O-methyltransferase YrrM